MNIDDLLEWTESVSNDDMNAEFAIVDDEMDVTMYRMELIEPQGNLVPATRDNHPLLGVSTISEIPKR